MIDSVLSGEKGENRMQLPPKPSFEISFNPNTTAEPLSEGGGGPETALVMFEQPCAKDGHIWVGKKFYILKGDFRSEYDRIISGGGCGSDCKRFYDEQKKVYGSRWSSDFHEWGADGKVRKSNSPDCQEPGRQTNQELFEDAIVDGSQAS